MNSAHEKQVDAERAAIVTPRVPRQRSYTAGHLPLADALRLYHASTSCTRCGGSFVLLTYELFDAPCRHCAKPARLARNAGVRAILFRPASTACDITTSCRLAFLMAWTIQARRMRVLNMQGACACQTVRLHLSSWPVVFSCIAFRHINFSSIHPLELF